MRRRVTAAAAITATAILLGPPAASRAQFSGWSPAERVLWLGLGSRRVSNADFMRTMVALQAMDRANITRQQQYLQQQMAAQRARAEQARLQGIMSRAPVGESRFPAVPVVDTPEERQQVSDLLLVWEMLGCTFDALMTDAVRAVDSRFDAGLRVAAIKVGGAADRAGWEAGDILVGLYRYRIRNYDNVAFVADLPDLVSLSPMRALLIHSGKVIELPLDFHGTGSEEKPATESSERPSEAPPEQPTPKEAPPAEPGGQASAIGTEVNEGGVVRAGGGAGLRTAPAEKAAASRVWDALGVRAEGVSIASLGLKYDRGLRLEEVRSGGAAEAAGWKAGETLVGLGGYQMRSVEDAAYVIGSPSGKGPIEYVLVAEGVVRRGTVRIVGEPAK